MLKLFLLKFSESDSFSQLEYLSQYLSIEKRERLLKTNIDKLKIRHISGEILAKYVCTMLVGKSFSDIEIVYDAVGKAFYKNEDIYFNISHSGDYLILAVSDKPVGVDIEKRKNFNFRIAERFFSASEYQWLNAQPKVEFESNFLKIWTAKEAYVKATGRGIAADFTDFSVCGHRFGEFKIADEQRILADYYQEKLATDYIFTVCILI